jgi:hypothetical protein
MTYSDTECDSDCSCCSHYYNGRLSYTKFNQIYSDDIRTLDPCGFYLGDSHPKKIDC